MGDGEADAYALLIQNGVLCLINAIGIYRWLLRPALAKATPSA